MSFQSVNYHTDDDKELWCMWQLSMQLISGQEFGSLFAVLDDVTAPLRVGEDVMLSFAASGPVLVPE